MTGPDLRHDPVPGTLDSSPPGGVDSPVPLAHGRWTAELRNDELADIAHDGVVLLRAVRVVVRDQDWGTVPPHRRSLDIEPAGDSLLIRLRVDHGEADASAPLLSWDGEIEFSPSGLAVRATCRARAPFRRNRIGLVVLHPMSDAGRRFTVTDPAGAEHDGAFPVEIGPHQPLRDVAALRWSTGHLQARLALTGDVFETEDQRNWTDASFKTYSTPLTEPFPVAVQPGDEIVQTATLTVTTLGEPARTEPGPVTPARLTLGDPAGVLPEIALAASTAVLDPVDVHARAALVHATGRGPHIDQPAEHVAPPGGAGGGLHGPGRAPAGRPHLDRASAEAGRWSADLDVRLIADDPAAVTDALPALVELPVRRLGVFSPSTHVTEPELWQAVSSSDGGAVPAGALVGGARSHFTELNRQLHRLPTDLPALTFSITPQMHTIEREHIVDSVGAQRVVATNAVRLAAGRPVDIGPVTLKPRFNAVATTAGLPVVPDDSDPRVQTSDPRQGTPFAAAWLIASVDALAVPGVRSLTLMETTGPRGLRPMADGPVYPAWTAAAWLTELAGRAGRPVLGALPDRVSALAADVGDETVLLIANLDRTTVTITLDLPACRAVLTSDPLGPGEAVAVRAGANGAEPVEVALPSDTAVRIVLGRS
ncbi:hypothetical protein [Nakamurella leprariae]|uniref:Uncharacterized protein n=1 Tax=Nakamurella leprariae TaxID=2803911 RepID=A0A938YGD7_9ACTN|nr:hypothetical protein [Nakamurella leprariae]MBM9469399.1 hypothetical protein [Nakamurella leprariae]